MLQLLKKTKWDKYLILSLWFFVCTSFTESRMGLKLLVIAFVFTSYTNVSKADSICEGLFVPTSAKKEYSNLDLLRDQATYLRLYFLRANERRTDAESRDKLSLDRAARRMGTTRYTLHAKVAGKVLMNFEDLIQFGRAFDIPLFNVMDYIIEYQRRENNGHKFIPRIPVGTYSEIAKDPTLSLEERIQMAQEAHLKRLLQLRAEPLGHTFGDIADAIGISRPGFANYIGYYTNHRRISYLNSLKLADILDIDVRDVFSFLLDFEGMPAGFAPTNLRLHR
jgi:hypothetical protein